MIASPARLLVGLLTWSAVTEAQYRQYWTRKSDKHPWKWAPRDGNKEVEVIFLPDITVTLEYNCAYMTAICKNAEQFIGSPRYNARPEKDTFTYDTDSSRVEPRRTNSKVCGRQKKKNWNQRHTCPEDGTIKQPPVWRARKGVAGEWATTALRTDGNTINEIKQYIKDDGTVVFSGLRYTCDEFPAASWVEGGAGVSKKKDKGGLISGVAHTICAGHHCPGDIANKGITGEQNWQATAHNALGDALKSLALKHGKKQGYTEKLNPIAFKFRKINENNGYPAKVIVTDSSGTELAESYTVHFPNTATEKRSTIARRELAIKARAIGMPEPYMYHWPELKDAGAKVTEYHIHFNETIYDAKRSMFVRRDLTSHLQDQWAEECLETLKGDSHLVSYSQDTTSWTGSMRVPGIRTSPRPRRYAATVSAPLLRNVTAEAIRKAEELVEAAIKESTILNQKRFENPMRNRYSLKPGTVVGHARRAVEAVDAPPPLLQITPELAAAAALIAEADAAKEYGNKTLFHNTRAGSFWMESIGRKGTVPWGDDSSYKVFRNVRDYGAKGDGVTDDTEAFKKAMDEGKRCGKNCNGSTTKNAIVYIPPGNYLISRPIPVYYGTQLVGDANNWPTLTAASRFIGLAVLSTDEYTGGGTGIDGRDEQWYVNTASFYRQIRNMRIDVTKTRGTQGVACVHYQVAQATSMQFVELIAKSGTSQKGIFAENGSGGVISDISFKGGKYGLYGGNQQFTALRLSFDGCETAVQLIWDWGWVWKSISVKNADVGFKLVPEDKKPSKRSFFRRDKGGESGAIGSASFLDSVFSNVKTAVLIRPLNSEPGMESTGVIIENSDFTGVEKAVADTTGKSLLQINGHVDFWVAGPTYNGLSRNFSMGVMQTPYKRESTLLGSQFTGGSNAYFERPKPQYENASPADFVHLKDLGAKGDGKTDDTEALRAAFKANAGGRIIHADAGTYMISDTVLIPPGVRIVGETWTQFAAYGKAFGDARNPRPMFRVGLVGDVGSVEMQDLMFTTKGQTPGVTLVEWNLKADKPGSAALWDCHARIGGASGTELTPDECPPITNGVNPKCQAASMMFHLTPRASGYFENMWLWVADHMIDDPLLDDPKNDMVQTSVYVARGFLIESQSPTWLYGTASEHSVYYQYNFYNAKNIFAGMVQTESPYYQPNPKPPLPFTNAIGAFRGDPTYACDKDANSDISGCDSSWAIIMQRSKNIFVAGAGVYSWFSTYSQDCIDTQACQKALVLLKDNYENIRFQHLITIGAKFMAVMNGKTVAALDNLNVKSHPRWSQVSVLQVSGGKGDPTDPDLNKNMVWVDPKIWEQKEPTVHCEPPCVIQLPPWPSFTSTYNYPVVTFSSGEFTTKVTRRPVTVSQWAIQPITYEAEVTPAPQIAGRKANNDYQALEGGGIRFVAKLAETTAWAPIPIQLPGGNVTYITPTVPTHPPPPPVSPSGSYSTTTSSNGAVGIIWIPPGTALPGPPAPTVPVCFFPDPKCPIKPGDDPDFPGTAPDPGKPDDKEEEEEKGADFCSFDIGPSDNEDDPDADIDDHWIGGDEDPDSPPPRPTQTPPPNTNYNHPDPKQNKKNCYNYGQPANHAQMDNSVNSFCKAIQFQSKGYLGPGYHQDWSSGTFPHSWVEILGSVDVKDGCQWTFNMDECQRYLHVPIDSCSCQGVDVKRGGTVENNCISWYLDPEFRG